MAMMNGWHLEEIDHASYESTLLLLSHSYNYNMNIILKIYGVNKYIIRWLTIEKFRETRKKIKIMASEKITPEECKKRVIELDQELNNYFDRLPIQKFPSGNYYYFRTIEYDYKTNPGKKRNIPKEKLGRILKSDYKKNKKIMDQLVKEKDKEELKKYLESY